MTTRAEGTRPERIAPGSEATARDRAAAACRILFGLLWGFDALLKWMPGFIDGGTLADQFARVAGITVPVERQWAELWKAIALANPSLLAHVIAVAETAVALAILLGFGTRIALVASAALSFGIWTAAEGMHLPWFTTGQTDLGPSTGYIVAALALLFAGCARVWSVDALLVRRRRRASTPRQRD